MKFKKYIIGANNIRKEGTMVISEALKINQTLQILDFSNYNLLWEIYLGNNSIGIEGKKILLEAKKYHAAKILY